MFGKSLGKELFKELPDISFSGGTAKTSDDFHPSAHIVPMDKDGQVPVVFSDEPGRMVFDKVGHVLVESTFLAITTDGRISALPTWQQEVYIGEHEAHLDFPQKAMRDRITRVFPDGRNYAGEKMGQYFMACVAYSTDEEAIVVNEAIGLKHRSRELDALWRELHSLYGTTIGGHHWQVVQTHLSASPIREWINGVIDIIQKRGWDSYVHRTLRALTEVGLVIDESHELEKWSHGDFGCALPGKPSRSTSLRGSGRET